MGRAVNVGIIGDYNPELMYHSATQEALSHAADKLRVPLEFSWVPTPSLAVGSVAQTLKPFQALWCAPGSPYLSMDGALEARSGLPANGCGRL